MPDNWGFVAAAYGLTAAVLLIYWRRLAKKERELERLTAGRSRSAERSRDRLTAEQSRERLTAEQSRERLTAERGPERLTTERSREPSRTGHPRPDPDSRPPLQQ